ncbi:hypothetical protein FALB51S_01173 [Frigidibacter albus]|uniref:Uncharacterized protein n=1 Tax=Frigidibacter mobilis TaxID=1335048 RepID=A0A159YYB0_9RHOB|nr:hypothetical protein AKL17_0174 [Frigidibacter mobilis]
MGYLETLEDLEARYGVPQPACARCRRSSTPR